MPIIIRLFKNNAGYQHGKREMSIHFYMFLFLSNSKIKLRGPPGLANGNPEQSFKTCGCLLSTASVKEYSKYWLSINNIINTVITEVLYTVGVTEISPAGTLK